MSDAADTIDDAGSKDLAYTYRSSVMRGMCSFRLAQDQFHWEVGRYSGAFPYRAIRAIRLSFRPITLAHYRFIAEIWADGVPKLTLSSTSWRSFVEQQRQDGEYLAFVRGLHERIGAAGGSPELTSGASPFAYWPGVAALALFLAALPVILWRTLSGGAFMAAALLAAFMAYSLWQIGSYFYRNRPGSYRLDALPSETLPRG